MQVLKIIVISPGLVAEYRRLLSQTEEMLRLHNEKQWVGVLQRWRCELTSETNFDLRQHAVRTARALGGIGSMSEIALLSQDAAFIKLLDTLYATCREIRYSQTVSMPR